MVTAIVWFEVPMDEGLRMVIVDLVDMLRRSECREHQARGEEETPGRLPETDHAS